MVGLKVEGLNVGRVDGNGLGHLDGSIVVGENVSVDWVGISVVGINVGL
jgi:hypothetical protein